ncbi:MAG: TatD family hydrolase, partial [Armatimonadota bacterium]
MPSLVDAHNHLQEEVLVSYVEGVIERARAAGVGEMWCNGTAENDWQAVADLARAHHEIVPWFGLHPWFVKERSADWLARLGSFLDAGQAGIGEIGLDRYVGDRDEAAQEAVFRAQLALAAERGLKVMPVLFNRWHSKELDYGGIYLDHFLPQVRRMPFDQTFG